LLIFGSVVCLYPYKLGDAGLYPLALEESWYRVMLATCGYVLWTAHFGKPTRSIRMPACCHIGGIGIPPLNLGVCFCIDVH
jgi:hypothetical protein